MAEQQSRLIKKYPNRRLYDTATSCYITLADVRDLVLAGGEFQVVDAKTGEDLTRSILLQIILEEESGGSPMFTKDMWAQFLNFQGPALHSMMGAYMEQSKRMFVQMQEQVESQARNLFSGFQFPNYSQPSVKTDEETDKKSR